MNSPHFTFDGGEQLIACDADGDNAVFAFSVDAPDGAYAQLWCNREALALLPLVGTCREVVDAMVYRGIPQDVAAVAVRVVQVFAFARHCGADVQSAQAQALECVGNIERNPHV